MYLRTTFVLLGIIIGHVLGRYLEEYRSSTIVGFNPNQFPMKAKVAPLRSPYGLSYHSEDIYFVSGNELMKLSSDGILHVRLGFQDEINGPLLNPLNAPRDLHVDAAGDIVYSDTLNHVIRKIYKNNTEVLIAGTWFTIGNSGDGGLATRAKLNKPSGVAVDHQGNIYFSDTENNRIRMIDTNGMIWNVVGNSSDASPTTDAALVDGHLNRPTLISMAPDSNDLYVVDEGNNRIQKISNGRMVQVADATNPSAVCALSNGELLYSDNQVIKKIRSDGQVIVVAGGGGNVMKDGILATSAKFLNIGQVMQLPNGDVIISDKWANRLHKVDATTNLISTLAGSEQFFGYSGDNYSPADEALLYGPSGVCVDNKGSVIFSDTVNNRIRKMFVNGSMLTIAGNGTQGYNGNELPALEAFLNLPQHVVCRGEEVFFTDTGNHVVRKITTEGRLINVFGVGASSGFNGDGLQGTSTQLSSPTQLSFYNNEIFVIDSGNQRIRKLGGNGIVSTVLENVRVRSIAHSRSGELYIGKEDFRIVKLLSNGVDITNIIGQGYSAFEPSIINVADATLQQPASAIAVFDTDDLLFIDGSMLRYVSNGQVFLISASSNGFQDGKKTMKSSYFGNPKGMFLTRDEELLVADTGNNVIRKVGRICVRDAHGFCEPLCFGVLNTDSKVCSGHGKCVEADTCQCDNPYYGRDCSDYLCFGHLKSSSNACSGHGQCVSIDDCSCSDGWAGHNCSVPICNGKHLPNEVCGGHGMCEMNHTCTCLPGWTGTNCEEVPSVVTCDHVPFDSPNVCSGNGKCMAKNVCSCLNGWIGSTCQELSPVIVSIGNVTSQSIAITWTISPVSGVSYHVDINNEKSLTTTSNYYDLSNLTPQTSYTIKVTVIRYGFSSAVSMITISTLCDSKSTIAPGENNVVTVPITTTESVMSGSKITVSMPSNFKGDTFQLMDGTNYYTLNSYTTNGNEVSAILNENLQIGSYYILVTVVAIQPTATNDERTGVVSLTNTIGNVQSFSFNLPIISEPQNSGDSLQLLWLLVIPVVLAVVIISVLAYYFIRKRKNSNEKELDVVYNRVLL